MNDRTNITHCVKFSVASNQNSLRIGVGQTGKKKKYKSSSIYSGAGSHTPGTGRLEFGLFDDLRQQLGEYGGEIARGMSLGTYNPDESRDKSYMQNIIRDVVNAYEGSSAGAITRKGIVDEIRKHPDFNRVGEGQYDQKVIDDLAHKISSKIKKTPAPEQGGGDGSVAGHYRNVSGKKVWIEEHARKFQEMWDSGKLKKWAKKMREKG